MFHWFHFRFPTNVEQAQKWVEAIRLYNERPIHGANGMVCFEHFQSHEFQMIKGKIHKLIPGAIPSVFLAFKENVRTPEIILSPEAPELSELPTLTPEIAPSAQSSKHDSGKDGCNAGNTIYGEECDQCVHEDETDETQENTTKIYSKLLQNVPNRLIKKPHRRWTDKTRYLKKRINRLRATANQIRQGIFEMKKQKKKDVELLNILEVCII